MNKEDFLRTVESMILPRLESACRKAVKKILAAADKNFPSGTNVVLNFHDPESAEDVGESHIFILTLEVARAVEKELEDDYESRELRIGALRDSIARIGTYPRIRRKDIAKLEAKLGELKAKHIAKTEVELAELEAERSKTALH